MKKNWLAVTSTTKSPLSIYVLRISRHTLTRNFVKTWPHKVNVKGLKIVGS